MSWAALWVIICSVDLAVFSYHVTYAFQSESTLYSCLNVKELLAWNRRDIGNLSDCNGTRMHRTDKYSQHSSIIWLVWLNHWMLDYELSGCELESRCCHLNFRYHACLDQGVPWYSDNYRVRIHSEMRTWHNKNIQASKRVMCEKSSNYFEPFFNEILCGFRKARST